MRVLEIGGGDNPNYCKAKGNGVNLDVRPLPTVDIVHDITKPLPFSDGEFESVYSSYALEHLPWRSVQSFVKELCRVLKPNGKALIITANLLEQCKLAVATKEWSQDISCTIFGGQEHEHGFHRCGFSPDYAIKLFKEAGFSEVIVKPHPNTETDMIIEALKGETLELAIAIDRFDWIRKHCRKGEKILDIGSADGHVFQGSGLEPYVTYLDIDRYNLPNFIHLDAQDLVDEEKSGIKNDAFDVAVLGELLEHVEDPVKVLKGAYRVAKRLLITVPDPTHWNIEYRPYETLAQAIERTGKTAEQLAHKDNPKAVEFYTEDGYEHLFHRRWYTKEMLENHLKQAGITNYTLNRLAYAGWSFFVVETDSQRQIVKTSKKKARKKPLKIGIISTPFFGVPPPQYGGLEQIIADLAEALTEQGQEVTVFAPNDSTVKCNLFEFGEPITNVKVNWFEAEKTNYEAYKNHILNGDYDIIHGNDWFGFEYALKSQKPRLKVCHTHHGGLYQKWWSRSKPPFKLNMIAISQWMKSIYEKQGFTAKFVYNGVNLEKYPFKAKKGKRLLYVGRFSTFKQPHVAIEIAKELNIPIDLVGGSFVDDPNYLERIKNMCDGDKVKMYLDASHETKIELMQKAKCLLFPSRMGEPFGLVAVEAMACGTSVVALNDGAISEVVKDGGLVCLDKGAMVDAIKQVHRINPKTCRRNAERFDRKVMAQNYLGLYRSVLRGDCW